MAMFAFVDPNIGELMLGNVPPDDVTQWWPVPFGARANDLYVDKHGEIALLPPRPSLDHEFDALSEEWVDTRSEEEKLAQLEYDRGLTYLPKSELLTRLMFAGKLAPQEAMASRIDLPPFVADHLEGAPEVSIAAETLRWAEAINVYRCDALLVDSLKAIGFTDESLDELFKGQ